MASKEELEALGIATKQCKECCRDISEDEYKQFKGYCKKCYAERRNIERQKASYNGDSNSNDIYEYAPKNTIAKIIKIISIISAIAGIIIGLVTIGELEVMSVAIIIVSIISAVFVYALGEIIQLLEDIKNK